MGAVAAILVEAGAGAVCAVAAAAPAGRNTLYCAGAGAAPIADAPYEEYGRGTTGALSATGP